MNETKRCEWKGILVCYVVGVLFSAGLCLSGMTRPVKIIGFLDVFGNHDLSLMFVMVGAIAFHFVASRLIMKRRTPVLCHDWQLPTKKKITPALVVGAALFGVGWGLGGYCPGPAVTSLASITLRPLLFVVSMLGGMMLFQCTDKKLKIER
jgi:uncharacterized protein